YAHVRLVRGDLTAGVRLGNELVALQYADLIGRDIRKRGLADAVARSQAIQDYLDLHEGDLVVHVAHGIAIYRGLRVREEHGVREEYLELEFGQNRKLQVPVVNCSLVQRYVGSRGFTPELSRLGTKWWSAKRQAVEDAVLGMANELLDAQAKRLAVPGIVFQP